MKRLFQVLGLLILLILGSIVILPIVFEDELISIAKKEINNNLEATVEIEEFDLSLFRSFPNFNLSVENITIDGKDAFEGVRLVDIGDFSVDIDLMSVLSGDKYSINSIALKNTRIHVLVDEEGRANYDIAKKTTEEEDEPEINEAQEAAPEAVETSETESESSQASSFELNLESYSIENFDLVYEDRQAQVKAEIKDLDHSGSGNFTEDIVDVKTKTLIEELTVISGGVAYLNRVNTSADFDLTLDNPNAKYTFGENEVRMNDLKLNFTGYVAMPEGENMDLDLNFGTPQNSFKSVLSLIPSVYYEDFKYLKTTGSFELKGSVKGEFDEVQEKYPPFDAVFKVSNASIQYPDLPSSVDGIDVNTHIYNPSTQLDGTVIEITKAKAVIAGSPIDASMTLKNPISNPDIQAYLKTDFELSNLAKAIPMEDLSYSGNVKGDLDLAAKMSDIDQELYDNVKAEGSVELSQIEMSGKDIPVPIKVSEAQMLFSPQYVDLKSFELLLGKSDISANGRIDNLLPFALRDDSLHGSFTINSNFLDLNELSAATETEKAQAEVETPNSEEPAETGADQSSIKDTNAIASTATQVSGVPRIPANLDFVLNTNIQKVMYDSLEIQNVRGEMTLRDGAARMENLKMDLIGGTLALAGGYDSKPAEPKVDMDFQVQNFGFKESFESLEMIRKMVPLMGKTEGTYSTNFHMTANILEDLSPDLNSILAQGNLLTKGLKTSPNSMQKLANITGNESLASLDIGKVDLKFKIENGRVEVEPFDIKAGNVSATVSGSNGLDQSLDYKMDMKLPVSGIKTSNLLNSIGASSGGKVDLGVNIGGTFSDPKVSTSIGDILDNVVDNITQQITDKMDEVKQDVVKKANEELQKLIAEASAKGDQLIAEAEKGAQSIRDAAAAQAQKLRDEANTQAEKLEKEAEGNFLKEAAAKEAAKGIREAADKKAKKLEDEADIQAQNLVDAAKAKKQKLIEEAEAKGKVD